MKFPKSKYPGIRQRGVNSWEIYYSKDGKKTTENFKGSEIEASIRRSQLILGAGSSVPSKSEDITFEQAFKSYTNVKSKLLDENTIQRSTCIFNHFVDYLSRVYPGVRFVAQVTPEIGTHYKNYMISDTNKRPSGINTDITKLRAIFTVFMSECFIIPSNPFKKVSKIPRREAKPKEKHLPTNQEVIILLNDFKNDVSYCEITRFLLRVGRRIEEVTEYLKKDVVFDPAGRPICVNGLALYYPDGRPIALKVRKEITKTDESGNILFDDELSEIVLKALLKFPKSPYLFTNELNHKIAQNTYREALKRACKKNKIPYSTPHCFRYYVVNKLMNAGANLKDAMAITGHIDVESFMHYLKSTPEGIFKALTATKINLE